jgi:gas vesicle protein
MKTRTLIITKTNIMGNSNDSLKVIGALMVGAAVGGVLGMLFAPAKGSESRKKLANKPEEITDSIKERFDDFLEEVKDEIELVKHKANDFMKDGAGKTERVK